MKNVISILLMVLLIFFVASVINLVKIYKIDRQLDQLLEMVSTGPAEPAITQAEEDYYNAMTHYYTINSICYEEYLRAEGNYE